ncbi:MAG: helix-turn-helix transcriptional regulator [Oscillospiraceae bacterium]|nr:helix-turn-helix transcriptional regulator [Oscillospiraceae bacterium]
MSNTFNLEMGSRIRKRREYLGYTREQFAEKAAISERFATEIELGNRGMSIATLKRMCEVLKVSSDYIISGREEKTDNSVIVDMFKNVDEKYIPYAEELLKVFIRSMNE